MILSEVRTTKETPSTPRGHHSARTVRGPLLEFVIFPKKLVLLGCVKFPWRMPRFQVLKAGAANFSPLGHKPQPGVVCVGRAAASRSVGVNEGRKLEDGRAKGSWSVEG